MRKNLKYIIAAIVATLACVLPVVAVYLNRDKIAMLNPKGIIAAKELDLMIIALVLMLVVVIPVFILTAYTIWKYRAGNEETDYRPDWDYSFLAEVVWWGFPCIIIAILSVITWTSSHELDPYKPLDSDKKPITIQVIALQWKWLFIYPEQNIATVNYAEFPEKTPINFIISADAPMNSFWVPQLGGQIYAMPGMKSKLHLIADHTGDYAGSSANLSGAGFAGMTFVLKATSQEDFDKWVKTAAQSTNSLDKEEYHQLAHPSKYNPVAIYTLKDKELFEWVVMKPMMPMTNSHKENNHPPVEHELVRQTHP